MGSLPTQADIVHEVLPYLRVLKDGTIDRIAGTGVVPPGTDPQAGVLSKDILIVPETGVGARVYRPRSEGENPKLPLVVYFHGGAFCIATVAEPVYHNSMNIFAAEAEVVILSVDYRLAPEHPLPTAYEDCWAALQWVATHVGGEGPEEWLNNVNFNKVFLAGDSAGANIAHHLTIRAGSTPIQNLKFQGSIMINPYFWSSLPIGSEKSDPIRRAMVDNWWDFVCPSDKGSEDPLINPFSNGSPCLSGLGCSKVLVCVAEKDILRDRGEEYYWKLIDSKWTGLAEMDVTEGEDHVFHIFNPRCEKALNLVKKWAFFISKD